MDIRVEFIKDKFQVTKESGHKFYVDAKEGNFGDECLNPIELLLSSLGACVGIYAKKYLRLNIFKAQELVLINWI